MIANTIPPPFGPSPLALFAMESITIITGKTNMNKAPISNRVMLGLPILS